MQKQQFIEFLLSNQVLDFGEYVTKSGRNSPYFLNAGNICSGNAIDTLGKIYAQSIKEDFGCNIDNLYGPAYKGIPLCVVTSAHLSMMCNNNVTFTFNRKEAKDHGEGGALVGHNYDGSEQVVITEDVLTAGTSLKESLDFFVRIGLKPKGVVVCIDRQELGAGKLSAKKEIEEKYDLKISTLLSIKEIVDALWNKPVLGKIWLNDATKTKIDEYLLNYCAIEDN